MKQKVMADMENFGTSILASARKNIQFLAGPPPGNYTENRKPETENRLFTPP